MPLINDRTLNQDYALPNAANNLSDDVERLRAALQAIDADMAAAATTAALNALRDELQDGPPAVLNTLNELAAAIGDDPAFSTTVATALGLRALTATTITGTSGIEGGGSLAENRTLQLTAAVLASLSLADSSVQPARTVFTSNGLQGGGDLSANRTFSLVNPTEGEATAGTDNVKAMTSLRTAQQVAAKPPGIPVVAKTSAYTLSDADTGKCVSITTGGITVPSSLAVGTTISIWNDSGSAQTITQGAGMTMYNSANAATGNRTLAGRGECVVSVKAAGVATISGAGLT